MSTAFDDDALQEGLAHGLYGTLHHPEVQPGLGTTLMHGADAPNPGTVTLSLYEGLNSNPFDHIGMAIGDGHVYGKGPVPGQEGWSLVSTVPGMVEPVDPKRTPIRQITLPADADQRAYLLKYLQDRSKPIIYQAETDNCANYLYDGLQGAGFKLPPRHDIELPDTLMEELRKMYDGNATAPQPR